jgi:D-alanine-D-alanine ligase
MPTTKTPSRESRKPLQRHPFFIEKKAVRDLKLVVVAFSHVEREDFPTEEAYIAELEVVDRANEVQQQIEALGVRTGCYSADRYFLSNLMVDKPDLIVNLVDTVRGRDALQTSVPAALELAGIPYTGAGMRGMVIGNDRNLFKELLDTHDIPTPDFQFISRRGTKIKEELGFPLIVKLNESGGSVGIDNKAVQETLEDAQAKVDQMISDYKLPVVVERFIDGPEITVVVFDDGRAKHVFMGQKKFRLKPDGKHYFTSLESYSDPHSYTYTLPDKDLVSKIQPLAVKAFSALHNRDYAKFDVRVDEKDGTPYFTDCNPNTAFGPDPGLPFTEVLALHRVPFQDALTSLLSKHARKNLKDRD